MNLEIGLKLHVILNVTSLDELQFSLVVLKYFDKIEL